MTITNLERKEIVKSAEFLEKLGYSRAEDPYSISYSSNSICFSIVYPPNSEESDVNIRFAEKNQVFSIGWIAFVREKINGSNDKLENVKKLLEYIQNHYSQIRDYQYCADSNDLVDRYVENNREKYECAIRNFLDNN